MATAPKDPTTSSTAGPPTGTDTKAADTKTDAAGTGRAGDAGEVQTGRVVVTDAPSAPFSTKTSDVDVDPRTGQAFGARRGLMGAHGFEALNSDAVSVVQGVDPDRIPVEVTPGVTPDAGGDELLAAAQVKCPGLTADFVARMGLTKEYLAQVARGEVPGPPIPGPLHTSDFYLTPGGFQQTPPGVPPRDVGGNAISR